MGKRRGKKLGGKVEGKSWRVKVGTKLKEKAEEKIGGSNSGKIVFGTNGGKKGGNHKLKLNH